MKMLTEKETQRFMKRGVLISIIISGFFLVSYFGFLGYQISTGHGQDGVDENNPLSNGTFLFAGIFVLAFGGIGVFIIGMILEQQSPNEVASE